MPHCIIEYATELEKQYNIKDIVETLNQDIVASNLFDNNTIKTRAIPYSTYLVGGKQGLFIHISIKLLKGRTAHQKQTLAKAVLKTLSEKLSFIDDITIEITDLNPDFYFKKA